jgi:hypothetical protein
VSLSGVLGPLIGTRKTGQQQVWQMRTKRKKIGLLADPSVELSGPSRITGEKLSCQSRHLMRTKRPQIVLDFSRCAQTECTDSPEGPTLVLALVAGAGAFAAWVRRSHRRGEETNQNWR